MMRKDMQMKTLNFSYFPTTTLLLDDNQFFLRGLALNLSSLSSEVLTVSYADPIRALAAIKNEFKPTSFLYRALHDTDLGDRLMIEEVYRPERFQEVSVALVDYLMPPMSGIEFCEKINELPIRAVIMTGNANLAPINKAIEAGVVDQMILKNEPRFLELLLKTIKLGKEEYFEKLTQDFIKHHSLQMEPWFNDPEFLKVFETLLKRQDLVEYYVVDHRGQILLFDHHGHARLLLVTTETALKNFSQYLASSGLHPSASTMSAII